jgi:hypothetical protein
MENILKNSVDQPAARGLLKLFSAALQLSLEIVLLEKNQQNH